MKYTVIWERSAEHDLTEIWLHSRLKHAINQAVAKIDDDLKAKPQECGESRERGRRAHFVWPLGVAYLIEEDDRQVRVLSVWHT